jgi:hypothetical protein
MIIESFFCFQRRLCHCNDLCFNKIDQGGYQIFPDGFAVFDKNGDKGHRSTRLRLIEIFRKGIETA